MVPQGPPRDRLNRRIPALPDRRQQREASPVGRPFMQGRFAWFLERLHPVEARQLVVRQVAEVGSFDPAENPVIGIHEIGIQVGIDPPRPVSGHVQPIVEREAGRAELPQIEFEDVHDNFLS